MSSSKNPVLLLVPAVFSVRPFRVGTLRIVIPPLALVVALLPGTVHAPEAWVVHIEPPDHVSRPEIVIAPAPETIPPLSSKVVIELAPVRVKTPPEIARSPAKVEVPE